MCQTFWQIILLGCFPVIQYTEKGHYFVPFEKGQYYQQHYFVDRTNFVAALPQR